MALSWGSGGDLAFSCERRLFAGSIAAARSATGSPIKDVAVQMQTRAQAGYGIDIEANIRVLQKQKGSGLEGEAWLEETWKWMRDLRDRWNAEDSGAEKPRHTPKWCGVLQVLAMAGQCGLGSRLGKIEASTRPLPILRTRRRRTHVVSAALHADSLAPRLDMARLVSEPISRKDLPGNTDPKPHRRCDPTLESVRSGVL